MVCLGPKPGAAEWKAQTNPLRFKLSYAKTNLTKPNL